MPKLKLSDFEQKKTLARVVIKKRMEIKQIKSKDLAKRLSRPEGTLYYRWQHPESFRLEDLWNLTTILGLSDQEILQIVRGKESV
jgi:hypothetical protein